VATLHPTTELVALAWLAANVPSIPSGLTLPEDITTWPNGYVVVRTVGGTPQIHIPQREPVVSLDCWAVTPDSSRPPWYEAALLAEQVYGAMRPTAAKQQVDPNTVVTITGGNTYLHAHVQTIYALSEPRVVPGDEAAYARYQFDALIRWVEAAS
jgi:hypothetical protein